MCSASNPGTRYCKSKVTSFVLVRYGVNNHATEEESERHLFAILNFKFLHDDVLSLPAHRRINQQLPKISNITRVL
jgi:hypothetical protein